MPQIGPIQQPTNESFCGNTEELKRANHMPAFLLIGSRPVAMRASGLSRDAHNRGIMIFIELGHTFHRERPVRPTVYTDAIMEKAYEELINIYPCLRTGWQLQSLVLEGSPLHQAEVQPQGAGAWQGHGGGTVAPPCSVAGLGRPVVQKAWDIYPDSMVNRGEVRGSLSSADRQPSGPSCGHTCYGCIMAR